MGSQEKFWKKNQKQPNQNKPKIPCGCLKFFVVPHLSRGFAAAFFFRFGLFLFRFFFFPPPRPPLHQECDQPEEGHVGSVTKARGSSSAVMRLSPDHFPLP